MDKPFLSEEMQEELRSLPDDILISTAVELRRLWLASPENGNFFLGLLAVGEELHRRGKRLSGCEDEAAFDAAARALLEKMILD